MRRMTRWRTCCAPPAWKSTTPANDRRESPAHEMAATTWTGDESWRTVGREREPRAMTTLTGAKTADTSGLDTEFTRGLGLYDSTMVVVGSMIGTGIFIVSADMARSVGSAGWLLVAWVVAGVLTVVGALAYGELAAMMPR